MTDDGLWIYTVCFNPSDYPGKYTCRRCSIGKGELFNDPDFILVADTIDPIRKKMDYLGLFQMPRQVGDDPVIVETWF